jgi:cytochrome c peroxidase
MSKFHLILILTAITSCKSDRNSDSEVHETSELQALTGSDSTNPKSLTAFPRICEIKKDTATCSTVISWDASDVANQVPICLFTATVTAPTNKKLISCAVKNTITIPWIAGQGNQFFLTKGSEKFSQATLIKDLLVLPVKADSSLDGYNYERVLDNKRIVYPTARSDFSNASWDGKLFFGTIGLIENKIGMTVRVLRSAKMEGLNASQINFNMPDLFSKVNLIDTDSLTSSEVAALLARPGFSNFGNLSALGKNITKVKIGFHLAVFPHASLTSNPYRSDKSGAPNSDSGAYSTYRLIGILPTTRAETKKGVIESPFNIIGVDRKKPFLTRIELQIVVSNPDKADADIDSIKLFDGAAPFRDTKGSLLHGYEPSVTLDGRLLVYSSNYRPAINSGAATVGYSYNQSPHTESNWTVPENLARMYYKHGPGATPETIVGGKRFSKVFSIARNPISEFDGERFTSTDVIIGSYPWVSFQGSEVIFTAKFGFHGAGRHGTTVVGEKTKWIMQRIDGQMEQVRGNVTDRYDIWNDSVSESIFGPGVKLNDLYAKIVDPNTGTAFGRSGWLSILNIPVGQFSSSWNSVRTLNEAPLPLNSFKDSFGFFMAGNRYAEVYFPNLRDDLLLYFPMNEGIKYNRELVNSMQLDAVKPPSENYRANGLKYVIDKVPDYSGNSQSGVLNSVAKFPFEFYHAENLWTDRRIVLDRNEGFRGNSVIVTKGGAITTNLLAKNVQVIGDNQAFSFSAWIKKSADGPLPFLKISSLINIWLNAKSINGRLYTSQDMSLGSEFNVHNVIVNNKWFNLSVVYGHRRLRIFLDSSLVLDQIFPGQILNNAASAKVNMVLGPQNHTAVLANQKLWIDEVYLYGIELPESEIKVLSFYKEKKMAEAKLPTEPLEKVNLGRRLFDSPLLSINGKVSCASCHSPDLSFADTRGTSIGWSGKTLSRQSPILLNLNRAKRVFWDGRSPSLKSQMLHPIYDQTEMGISDVTAFLAKIGSNFGPDFNQIYKKSPDNDSIADALAHYVLSLRYDGDNPLQKILTGDAEVGRRLFIGKANCVACHNGAELSDFRFHDVGLAEKSSSDLGFGRFFQSKNLKNAMKTPSLINISKTGPYFHDGRFTSLQDVVNFYNKGGDTLEAENRSISPNIRPLDLTAPETKSLVSFLLSLDREYSR